MEWFGDSYLIAYAQTAIRSSNKYERAKALCYVTRALEVTGHRARKKIQDAWKESVDYLILSNSKYKAPPTDRLLHEIIMDGSDLGEL
jgi:hypothetical protein